MKQTDEKGNPLTYWGGLEEANQDMKQTAVEWLEQEIFRRYKFTFQQLNCGPLEEAINQAKEMEKQQIVTAFINGDNSDCTRDEDALLYALSYYNETFNK